MARPGASDALYDAVRDRVDAFLRGELPLRELRQWVNEHVQELATDEGAAYRLYDLFSAFEAQHAIGDIDEAELRAGIRAELSAPDATVVGATGTRTR